MASCKTLENLAKFVDFGNYLNMIPFKLKAKREAPTPASLVPYSTTYECVTCTSKKYFVNFSFAIVVTILLMLVFVKELVLNTASMEIEAIVLMMTLISLSLIGLSTHLWLAWKMETIASHVNTYLRLNYHLGKYLINAYSTNDFQL